MLTPCNAIKIDNVVRKKNGLHPRSPHPPPWAACGSYDTNRAWRDLDDPKPCFLATRPSFAPQEGGDSIITVHVLSPHIRFPTQLYLASGK
ncbi:hypothetical protein LX36DRAFT_347316 [Colletotrichum falcatum]|nr:hypothetical protein LX36DRAFT_347316 [Colletotrichum falcatum]